MEALVAVGVGLAILTLLVEMMKYALFWVAVAFLLFITMMVMLFSGALGPALGLLILAFISVAIASAVPN